MGLFIFLIYLYVYSIYDNSGRNPTTLNEGLRNNLTDRGDMYFFHEAFLIAASVSKT